MATYFGEILEPTTRGIFEEFSDEEDDIRPVEFCLCWFETKETVPSSLDTIFVYHGRLSVVLIHCYNNIRSMVWHFFQMFDQSKMSLTIQEHLWNTLSTNNASSHYIAETFGSITKPYIKDYLKKKITFAEAYLISENPVPVGEITLVENNVNEENLSYLKPKFLPSRLYLENNVGTCLVSPTYSSDIAFKFTECISELLKLARQIIVFTDESSSNYKAQPLNDLPPAYMRQLKTSYNSSDYIVQELPVPNIIAGISAAIASWCQINKKDASVFICYTDQQKLDSLTAAPYLSIIKKLRPESIKNANPDISRKKFYGNPDLIGGSSNIYI